MAALAGREALAGMEEEARRGGFEFESQNRPTTIADPADKNKVLSIEDAEAHNARLRAQLIDPDAHPEYRESVAALEKKLESKERMPASEVERIQQEIETRKEQFRAKLTSQIDQNDAAIIAAKKAVHKDYGKDQITLGPKTEVRVDPKTGLALPKDAPAGQGVVLDRKYNVSEEMLARDAKLREANIALAKHQCIGIITAVFEGI